MLLLLVHRRKITLKLMDLVEERYGSIEPFVSPQERFGEIENLLVDESHQGANGIKKSLATVRKYS